MVFLSEASVREMVQEALGGGGYPTLDGDGNFPIVPSPLAEPIVTKFGLNPVRVMRIPTDKHEFELAVKELVDGVESDHLPTLFLKLRELVADFVPEELEASPLPHKANVDNTMSSHNDEENTKLESLRAEVRSMIRLIISEAGDEDDEDPEFKKAVAPFRPGGERFIPSKKKHEPELPRNIDDEETTGDDWDSDDLGGSYGDDPGGAETDPADEPYPAEYLADPGYPDIGEDPEFNTWEDLEKDIAGSAWEPEDRNSELDKFRGRDQEIDNDINKAAATVDTIQAKKAKDAVGGEMAWDDIASKLGVSKGTVHGDAAIAGRKLAYVSEYLGQRGFEEFYEDATDRYINYLISMGSDKDENGKTLLSMGEVMALRAASKFDDEEDEMGERTARDLDPEAAQDRKHIQDLPGFREFVNQRLEYEMKVDGYAVSHVDAAKDKDKFSVFHRMKRTTR